VVGDDDPCDPINEQVDDSLDLGVDEVGSPGQIS
jgi:hypothetical protein